MIYYLIRNKKTGKYVKRTKSYGVHNDYVDSADQASLIRSGSAASMIVQNLDSHIPRSERYLSRRAAWYRGDHEVVTVGVLIYPAGAQPFIDGVLNDKP